MSTTTPATPATPATPDSVGSLGVSGLSVETKEVESTDTFSDITSHDSSSSSSTSGREHCSICQHVLSVNESVSNSLTESSAVCPQVSFRCGHCFHRDCVAPLLSGTAQVLCPNCRAVVREGLPPRPATPDSGSEFDPTQFDPDPSLDSSSSTPTLHQLARGHHPSSRPTTWRLPAGRGSVWAPVQDSTSPASSSSSGRSQAERVWESVGQGRRRPSSSSGSSSRPTVDVSLMDPTVLTSTFTQSATVSVEQIDRLLRRLQRRAFMILDGPHIKNRAVSRAKIPREIRRLQRQIQMYQKKLADLTTHAPLDDEWTELMNQRRDALRLTAHDAPPPVPDDTDSDDDDDYDTPPSGL